MTCALCDQPTRANGLCMKHYQQGYQPEYQRRRYEERMDEMKAYLGGRCVRCGTTDELQFDHVDPTTKCFSIARYWNRPWKIMVVELDKCQLLCKPHHRDKTIANGDLRGKRKDRPPK